MKRSQYSSILRDMERLRMDSYEAETKREERRLLAEYKRLAKLIEPYALGKRELEADTPVEAAGERAAWASAR